MRFNGYTPSAHSFPSHTPLSQVYRLIPQKEPKCIQSCCTKIQRILQSLTIIQFDPFILHTSHLFECLTHTSTISLFFSRWVPGLVKYHLKARDSKRYLASHRASGVYSLRSGTGMGYHGSQLRHYVDLSCESYVPLFRISNKTVGKKTYNETRRTDQDGKPVFTL